MIRTSVYGYGIGQQRGGQVSFVDAYILETVLLTGVYEIECPGPNRDDDADIDSGTYFFCRFERGDQVVVSREEIYGIAFPCDTCFQQADGDIDVREFFLMCDERFSASAPAVLRVAWLPAFDEADALFFLKAPEYRSASPVFVDCHVCTVFRFFVGHPVCVGREVIDGVDRFVSDDEFFAKRSKIEPFVFFQPAGVDGVIEVEAIDEESGSFGMQERHTPSKNKPRSLDCGGPQRYNPAGIRRFHTKMIAPPPQKDKRRNRRLKRSNCNFFWPLAINQSS